MNNTISRTLALALTAFVLGCPKPPTEEPTETPTDTPTPAESATVCRDRYTVTGAVEDGKIQTTVGGENINSTPFECTLVGSAQRVVFDFTPTSKDPISGCEYQMKYSNKVTGNEFSEQTLSCAESSVGFNVVADNDPNHPECKVDALDPQIQLRTNNCGQGED